MSEFSRLYSIVFLFLIWTLSSCSSDNDRSRPAVVIPGDPHSFSRPETVRTDSLHLDLTVDFSSRVVFGTAVHFISTSGQADTFILDTDGLDISSVSVDGEERPFQIGHKDELLGAPLSIPIDPDSREVRIRYRTAPEAKAFLWVTPEQTADGNAPFLFTQGQAILTRSWIPCQDSPGVRFPYSATVKVPEGMMAVMSASNPDSTSSDGMYHFRMELPVPAYLMALAAGELVFTPVGDRTGIYAEPGMAAASAYEFSEMERMLEAAEALYGPYRWGRYDLIVLPPSFPFGGMENPRLTFVTPTVIAGDRSLTSLIAHELAHSWSGNLVTNATWNDFWLNEGFTTYFERRIMEALYGKDYADMLAVLGYQDLQDDLRDLGEDSDDTKLELDLKGRDPDDGLTDIAYEKGAMFLVALEQLVGRDQFDQFLTGYFNTFAFQTMSTAEFVRYLLKAFPELENSKFPLEKWIYGPGLPASHPIFHSSRFEAVEDRLGELKATGKLPELAETKEWSTHEWLHFLRGVDSKAPGSVYTGLEERFGLTRSGNAEVLAIWLQKNIEAGRTGMVRQALRDFLVKVGRRKFLMPIYRALLENGETDVAKEIFREAAQGYHAVSFGSVDNLIKNYTLNNK